MLGMANLQPNDTGVPVVLHVYKDVDHRVKHAPRVKAFPGSPYAGDATVVTIPTHDGARAALIGNLTIPRRSLKRVLAFVDRNWEVLLLYWHGPEFGEAELRRRLKEVA